MIRVTKKIRFFTLVLIIFFTALLAYPRFAHYTPDSKHYVNLTYFFQDKAGFESIRTPYAYRIMVAYLAALGPFQTPGENIALVNTLFLICAYIVFYWFLTDFLGDETSAILGIALAVFSFPTFNYASGVLTDPTALFFFIAALYALLHNRLAIFCTISAIGILARESNLALSLVLLLDLFLQRSLLRRKINAWTFLYCIPPLLMFVMVRMYFRGLSAYPMVPTISRLVKNFSDPVVWITCLLTLLPLLIIILAAFFSKRGKYCSALFTIPSEDRVFLLCIFLGCCASAGFALFTVTMSGRYLWPLYVVFVPLAATALRAVCQQFQI